MAETDPRAAKSALRQSLRAWRNSLSAETRAEWSEAASRAAFGVLPDQTLSVGGYWAIQSEADPLPLVTALRARRQAVTLPVVTGRDEALQFRLWQSDAALLPAGFGTSAPGPDAPAIVPDLLIMPLLGFDEAGTRLGYGGGYYDRTLAGWPHRPVLLGFGFSGQRVSAIPREAHDIALDAVVTEAGLTLFTNRMAGLVR